MISHPWNLSPQEAIALQKDLADKVIRYDQLDNIRYIAGVDVGFENNHQTTRAAVALLSYPDLKLKAHAIARRPTDFPYVPGLLSFREIPASIQAIEQLKQKPDLILCDGQGLAHPRRLGIACHLGLLLDIPTIVVGKTRLIGKHEEPPNEKGSWVPLMDKGEEIGAVLRTRVNVKPLYISLGHRISLTSAVDYVMHSISRYRLPETTRWAHRLASGDQTQIQRALDKERVELPI